MPTKVYNIGHKETMFDKALKGIAVLLIFVVLIGVVGYYTGYIKSPFAVGTQQTQSQQPTVTYSGGVCPTTPTAGYPKVKIYAYYINPTNGTKMSVAVAGNALQSGQSIAVPFVTIANNYVWLNGTLPCGSTAQFLVGDNTHQYATLTSPISIGANYTTVGVLVANAAVPSSILFQNGSSSWNSIVGGGQKIVGATPSLPFNIQLRGGSGCYGCDGGMVFWAIYNSVEVSAPSFSSPAVSDPSLDYAYPSTANVPNTNYRAVAFIVPGGLGWGRTMTINGSVSTTAAFASNTQINMAFDDVVPFLNGVNVTNDVTNPLNSGQDLGLAMQQVGADTENTAALNGAYNLYAH